MEVYFAKEAEKYGGGSCAVWDALDKKIGEGESTPSPSPSPSQGRGLGLVKPNYGLVGWIIRWIMAVEWYKVWIDDVDVNERWRLTETVFVCW